MADDGRTRLGRGLAALIGDVGEETKTVERGRNQRRVPVAFLRRNPRNPRRNFSDTEIEELAASIKERGVIQPIVVRPVRRTSRACFLPSRRAISSTWRTFNPRSTISSASSSAFG